MNGDWRPSERGSGARRAGGIALALAAAGAFSCACSGDPVWIAGAFGILLATISLAAGGAPPQASLVGRPEFPAPRPSSRHSAVYHREAREFATDRLVRMTDQPELKPRRGPAPFALATAALGLGFSLGRPFTLWFTAPPLGSDAADSLPGFALWDPFGGGGAWFALGLLMLLAVRPRRAGELRDAARETREKAAWFANAVPLLCLVGYSLLRSWAMS
ncbi:MAG: hypothetical protein FD180_3373 [Planctomycetota bacterium]|nr:MAG: hypothetical protein FD180_3373 [Planctomycetota bacterium]